jgi:hypothetical protein
VNQTPKSTWVHSWKSTWVHSWKSTWVLLQAALGVMGAAGCGDPLEPPWLIDKTRVLGARVEAVGDPGRPWLRAGESAEVKWIVAAPEDAPAVGWSFVLCLPDAGSGCETPLAQMSGVGTPDVTFTVPAQEALGTADHLLMAGVFCAGGQPASMTGTCEGGGTATVVTLPLLLDRGGPTNQSPSLAAAAITFGGEPWPASADCGTQPRVAADGQKHPIAVTLTGQREVYQSTANPEGVPASRRESLQLSHFATGGKLPRQLTFIEGKDDSDPATVSVEWTAPTAAEVPPAGLVVRFFFVARDLRGGLDWQTRSLCVSQP